jgi:hypothetical protein
MMLPFIMVVRIKVSDTEPKGGKLVIKASGPWSILKGTFNLISKAGMRVMVLGVNVLDREPKYSQPVIKPYVQWNIIKGNLNMRSLKLYQVATEEDKYLEVNKPERPQKQEHRSKSTGEEMQRQG